MPRQTRRITTGFEAGSACVQFATQLQSEMFWTGAKSTEVGGGGGLGG